MRKEIADLIHLNLNEIQTNIQYTILEKVQEEGYTRNKIEYISAGMKVPAYLLLPDHVENSPAILLNHQHNSERHFGKSEVCGLVGSPYQAFGPILAKNGYVVLAPDMLCFEERRRHATGTIPLENDLDFYYHLTEMSYSILNGELLMKRYMLDTMAGISLLLEIEGVDPNRIGTLGHSMGGNTVQFLGAMDERISFLVASGSSCSYKNRIENEVGIELASVIPNFYPRYDISDLLTCIAPRKLLVLSATEDKYSRDAKDVVEIARKKYIELNQEENLVHKQYRGAHPLDEERFNDIINWILKNG